MTRPVVHFVGFRGDEYLSALRVWGPPHYVHMTNDPRMRRELSSGDTVVYARGVELRPRDTNSSDLTPQDPENGV